MGNLYLTKPISVPLDANSEFVTKKLCKLLGVEPCQIQNYSLHKQSVDARDKGQVHFVCSYVVESEHTLLHNASPYVEPVNYLQQTALDSNAGSIIVVGAGPSGLFLSLYLAKCGWKVTVVERGSDVLLRKQKVLQYFNGGDFDENCNVQFGLGGAGTFSDGKLTTGISSPLTYTVFNQFVKNGAPKDILTDSLPHVGTDKLVNVVANLRDEIISFGGKFLFDSNVTDIVVQDGVCKGVVVQQGNDTQTLTADKVAICCGNSARQLFHALVKHDVQLDFKPFAVGLRVEHTRQFINTAQYGKLFATHKDLPSASYKLTNKCADGHGCYSFCMCPGGVVVCANSEKDTVVVNGMSNYARDDANSNSAIVVTVSQDDVSSFGFGTGASSGIAFQQYLEQLAYTLGGGNYVAPCQNVTDFINDVTSTKLDITPSYPRGTKLCNLRQLLPKALGDNIAQSLLAFDKKIKGFAQCGVLTGVETRTSCPIKILRNDSYQTNVANLYPVGEGAGYAGGIVSSAVDGLRVAMAIVENANNNLL